MFAGLCVMQCVHCCLMFGDLCVLCDRCCVLVFLVLANALRCLTVFVKRCMLSVGCCVSCAMRCLPCDVCCVSFVACRLLSTGATCLVLIVVRC